MTTQSTAEDKPCGGGKVWAQLAAVGQAVQEQLTAAGRTLAAVTAAGS